MGGYFILFSLSIIFCFEWFENKKKASFIFKKKNIVTVCIAFLLLIPVVMPYFTVSREMHFVRDIREAIHLGLQPEDLLVGDEYTRIQPVLQQIQNPGMYPANAELKPGFIGIVFSLLALCLCVYIFAKKRKSSKHLWIFTIIGLVGLILAFGPALHIGRKTIHHPFLIPLPYAVFYYILPGFQGFRNAARFEILSVLGTAIASSVFLAEILKKRKRFIQLGIPIILITAIVGEFNFPMKFQPAPTFEELPGVYTWIAQYTPKNAVILEAPVYNWDNNPFGDNREVLREYYSTLHFRNLVSGGSGFSPVSWQEFARQTFRDFPSDESLIRIKSKGTQYIVVHAGEFDSLDKQSVPMISRVRYNGIEVINLLDRNPLVKRITQVNKDYVYKIK